MRNKIIKNINILFEQEKDYYKPLRVFHIEYESNGDRNKTLSIKEYLDVIKPYLKDITNNFQKSNTCKIQLTIEVKFISPKEIDAECIMHSKSDNIEFMRHDKTDEFIK